MKPFTNKFFYLCIGVTFFAACGKGSSAENEVSSQEVIVVEEEASVLEKEKQPVNVPTLSTPATTASTASASTASQTPSFYPAEVVTALKNWDKKLTFLTTHFEQTSSYDGVQISHSQGTLQYDKKHDFLRLDTLNDKGALEQSAYTDKQKIVIFDESGHRVTELSWEEWQQGQPNQALFDFGNYAALLDRHHVELQREQQHPVLILTPKDEGDYTLYLTLDNKDYFPTSIKIVSDLMVTQSDLTQTDKTTPIASTTFGGLSK